VRKEDERKERVDNACFEAFFSGRLERHESVFIEADSTRKPKLTRRVRVSACCAWCQWWKEDVLPPPS
jgi:hypothetical protein